MRTLWTLVVALISTVYVGSRIVISSWLMKPLPDKIARDLPRKWAASLLWAAGARVEMEGLEHLPPDQPAILVSNHESWFDVFALVVHLPVNYRFVGKQELVGIPFFGPAWVACGHIPIDRSDRQNAIESLERAGEIIRRERAVVVMFPEGTRSDGGELLPFKKGAFALAQQTGVPVVPVGIRGSRRIMAKGSWRIRSGTIRVRIGAPIPVPPGGAAARNVLLEKSREAVEALRTSLPATG